MQTPKENTCCIKSLIPQITNNFLMSYGRKMGLTLARVIHGISEEWLIIWISLAQIYSFQFSGFKFTYIGKEMGHLITCIENYLMKLLNDR